MTIKRIALGAILALAVLVAFVAHAGPGATIDSGTVKGPLTVSGRLSVNGAAKITTVGDAGLNITGPVRATGNISSGGTVIGSTISGTSLSGATITSSGPASLGPTTASSIDIPDGGFTVESGATSLQATSITALTVSSSITAGTSVGVTRHGPTAVEAGCYMVFTKGVATDYACDGGR